ncbi:hypothetical protein BgiBS90_035963 [Biomphalaria glabrata]|nr:hypothetical protein BgiBS90_035963 [Biomphalaria glabrata]
MNNLQYPDLLVGTAVTAATVEQSETLQTACTETSIGLYRVDDSLKFRSYQKSEYIRSQIISEVRTYLKPDHIRSQNISEARSYQKSEYILSQNISEARSYQKPEYILSQNISEAKIYQKPETALIP